MLIDGSQVRTSMTAMLLFLVMGSAIAQDDLSQRPLPLPERGVTDLPQHMELLKRLRSLVESQQKNSEKPAGNSDQMPRLPELPSSADSDAKSAETTETPPEPSPFQPQQLQQFQDALKNLASQLPPGFVPPDLSSVPPDQLRKAMENPAIQQQMRNMLEQFAKDGVLPQPGQSGGSQLPVPPQNDDRVNDEARGPLSNSGTEDDKLNDRARQNEPEKQNEPSTDGAQDSTKADGSADPSSPASARPNLPRTDESVVDDSDMAGSVPNDPDKEAPSGSMRSLRSFLKKLAEDTGLKSKEPSTKAGSTKAGSGGGSSTLDDSAPGNLSPKNESESGAATDDQTGPSEPKNSVGTNNGASPRRPLRKRDSAKPKTSPPVDPTNSSASDSNNNSAAQSPAVSSPSSNAPNTQPDDNLPDNAMANDAPEKSPAVSNSALSNPPQGLKIDPESARKQLEELQKTIERMKQVAEESDPGRSEMGRSSSNGGLDQSRSNDNDLSSDSNSVTPSARRNNRIAGSPDSDNMSGEQLPDSLPDVDQFLREQLKEFKLPSETIPGTNSRNDQTNESSSSGLNPMENSRGSNGNQRSMDRRVPIDSIPRDLSMERTLTPEEIRKIGENLRRQNLVRPDNKPSVPKDTTSEKPPIDIAKELEQRGFGNTLKQLVERAKEEAKKPRQPVPDPVDSQKVSGSATSSPADSDNVVKDATGAAKKSDPELSDSVAKMLNGLKDDLVEIAKDAKFNDPPQRPRRDRSSNRPSTQESNSMIDELRKSASEILSGPSRSPNNGNSAASPSSSVASNAFSGEFDFTPVLILAGVLAALAFGFFGLRHFRFRGDQAAQFQFAGPPLKPADIKSRADVVRAFHEFALQSAQSVQTWWTHRTVQRAILEKAPEYRAAVETLANTYEQARYLPAEQELSPEQLESARSALKQCETKRSV